MNCDKHCNTSARAVAAACAVHEARVVVLRVTGRTDSKLDDELFALEMSYWRRADALTKPKPRRAKGAKKR